MARQATRPRQTRAARTTAACAAAGSGCPAALRRRVSAKARTYVAANPTSARIPIHPRNESRSRHASWSAGTRKTSQTDAKSSPILPGLPSRRVQPVGTRGAASSSRGRAVAPVSLDTTAPVSVPSLTCATLLPSVSDPGGVLAHPPGGAGHEEDEPGHRVDDRVPGQLPGQRRTADLRHTEHRSPGGDVPQDTAVVDGDEDVAQEREQ